MAVAEIPKEKVEFFPPSSVTAFKIKITVLIFNARISY
jgi:hypothetical protein